MNSRAFESFEFDRLPRQTRPPAEEWLIFVVFGIFSQQHHPSSESKGREGRRPDPSAWSDDAIDLIPHPPCGHLRALARSDRLGAHLGVRKSHLRLQVHRVHKRANGLEHSLLVAFECHGRPAFASVTRSTSSTCCPTRSLCFVSPPNPSSLAWFSPHPR